MCYFFCLQILFPPTIMHLHSCCEGEKTWPMRTLMLLGRDPGLQNETLCAKMSEQ